MRERMTYSRVECSTCHNEFNRFFTGTKKTIEWQKRKDQECKDCWKSRQNQKAPIIQFYISRYDCKVRVLQSFTVKDELKSQGFKFDFLNKSWDKDFKPNKEVLTPEALKELMEGDFYTWVVDKVNRHWELDKYAQSIFDKLCLEKSNETDEEESNEEDYEDPEITLANQEFKEIQTASSIFNPNIVI